jgi:hypothetical protein
MTGELLTYRIEQYVDYVVKLEETKLRSKANDKYLEFKRDKLRSERDQIFNEIVKLCNENRAFINMTERFGVQLNLRVPPSFMRASNDELERLYNIHKANQYRLQLYEHVVQHILNSTSTTVTLTVNK